MSIRVNIKNDHCAGCGYCTSQIPEVLELQDTAVVKPEFVTVVTDPALIKRLKTVAEECPCEAIVVEEIVTNP